MMLGLFDGHGGPWVAEYAAEHIVNCMLSALPCDVHTADIKKGEEVLKSALHTACLDVDRKVRA